MGLDSCLDILALINGIAKLQQIRARNLKVDLDRADTLDADQLAAIGPGDLFRIGKVDMGAGKPVTLKY